MNQQTTRRHWWSLGFILMLLLTLSGCGASTTGAQAGSTLEFHAFDIGFKPTTLEVAQPGRYTIKLINDGVLPHDITFPDGTTIVAQGGETVSGEVSIPEGGTTFICAVPGHEQAGMKGSITVRGSASAPAPASS